MNFRKYLEERIHLVPKLTQKLVTIPMSLDRPYWVDDPDFDLNLHLHRIALPCPAPEAGRSCATWLLGCFPQQLKPRAATVGIYLC